MKAIPIVFCKHLTYFVSRSVISTMTIHQPAWVICPFEASHIAYRISFTFYIQFKSAVTTFDILRNFTRIPVENLEDLHSHLDDPSNGMMLDFYAHTLFDNFKWCLNKAEVRVPSIVIISLTTHPDRRCVHSETLQCPSIAHA